MTRQTKQTLIRCALEATYGAAPVFANTDALLISNPSHRIIRNLVDREIWLPHLGATEQLVAARVAEIKFEVELAGSGTAGTAPQWAKLMRGCGFAQTVTAASRVEWNPISTGFESLTFQYFRSGVRYTSRGARGTAKLMLPAFGLPKIAFTYLGFETAAAEGSIPGSYDLTGWQRPQVLTDEMSGDIRLGGTFTTGVVSGGTVLASRGIEIDIGNKVEHMELLGGERVSITDRIVTGKMSTALTAAEEVAWRTEINTNTNVSLGFSWGTTAGNRGTIWAPKVQRVDPQGEDYKGDLMIATDLRLQPTPAGNDDFILVMR